MSVKARFIINYLLWYGAPMPVASYADSTMNAFIHLVNAFIIQQVVARRKGICLNLQSVFGGRGGGPDNQLRGKFDNFPGQTVI